MMPTTASPAAEIPAAEPRCVSRLQAVISIGGLALVGTSWRLWTPQSVFPQVPLWSGAAWPDLVSWVMLGVLAGGLLLSGVQGMRGVTSRWGAVLCLAAMLMLVVEDQHRLQAWAVHLLWLWAIFLVARGESIPRLVLGLTVSVYLYSAISKFNPAFAEQHGRVLLGGLAKVAGIDIKRWPPTVLARLPYLLPAVEMIVAAGLAWRKTRTVAAWVAVAMHIVLIATFSPWGLHHAYGVLIWNGLFAVQALLLWCFPFALRRSGENVAARLSFLERFLLAAVLVVPAGRLWGVADQWVGWSLYSPRSEVIRIHLSREPEAIDRSFPDFTSRRYQIIHADFTPVEFVPDRWSLAAVDVPLNPESRMELAVAIAVCERYGCWDLVSLERERRSLFTDDVERSTYSGREEILALAEGYRLNVRVNRRYVDGVATVEETD